MSSFSRRDFINVYFGSKPIKEKEHKETRVLIKKEKKKKNLLLTFKSELTIK